MKKLFGLILSSLLLIGTSFAYTYWEFDGVKDPSNKTVIFHTVNVADEAAEQENFDKTINDYHNEFMDLIFGGLPPAKEYTSMTWEVTEAFYPTGEYYRVIFSNINVFGDTGYFITVYRGKEGDTILRVIKQDECYSFNSAHDKYEMYIDEYCKNFDE